MSITKNAGRQHVIAAAVSFAFGDLATTTVTQSVTIAHGDLTSGVAHNTGITLPPGAVVTAGSIAIGTAFDSGTSDVIDVGDVSSNNRYLNDGDLQSAGPIALVPTGFACTPTQSAVYVKWVAVGTAIAHGSFTLSVTYSVTGGGGIEVPAGAVITAGALVITEAFDSGTSDELDVGDGANTARYLSAADGQALGVNPLVPTGYQYTAADTIDVTWRGVGTAATAGAGRLDVQYMVVGRATHSQG